MARRHHGHTVLYYTLPDGAYWLLLSSLNNPPHPDRLMTVCAVCSSGYGSGTANDCHECTDSFKGGMYFLVVVVVLLALTVAYLIAVYLVRQRRHSVWL